MSLATQATAWRLFLGSQTRASTASDIGRMRVRLDDAHDAIGYVLRSCSGCPDDEVEYDLRAARSAVLDAMERLSQVILELRLGDPNEVA